MTIPASIVAQFRTVALERLDRVEHAWATVLTRVDDEAIAVIHREIHTLKGESQLVVRTAFGDFAQMQHALEGRSLVPVSSQSEYVAANLTELPEGQLDEVMGLVAALESDDDVQNVYTNLA